MRQPYRHGEESSGLVAGFLLPEGKGAGDLKGSAGKNSFYCIFARRKEKMQLQLRASGALGRRWCGRQVLREQ